MKLTPRKTEITRVVELLESNEFNSADQLAKAVIKAVWESLMERDLYALLFKFDSSGIPLAWGPFTSDNEAETFARRLPLPGPSRTAVLKLYSVAQQARKDAEHLKLGTRTFCASCKHPSYVHEHDKMDGACAVRGCRCKRIKEEAIAA